MPTAIPLDRARIAAFCRVHHIRRLALFGSVTRPDYPSQSDVDVLVEFAPEHVPGLAFFSMQDELASIIGRPVDLNTPQFLSRSFRDEVVAGSDTIYAGG